MSSVLIVDDEPVFRLAMKSIIDWNALGFTSELEAENGKEALSLLEKYDDINIVFTDINMPVMDGLELISAINTSFCDMPIIVLSAYDDFNLVRQAFKRGAHDYLLKTDLKAEGVTALLSNLTSLKRNKSAESLSKNEYRHILKESFLKDLVQKDDTKDIEERFQNLQIRLNRNNIFVCFIWVEEYQVLEDKYSGSELTTFSKTIINAISQVLSKEKTGEAVAISPQEYVILVSYENIKKESSLRELKRLIRQIKYYLSNYLNVGISVGVSAALDGLQGIRAGYRQADSNVRFRLILGKGKIIFPEDVHLYSIHEAEEISGRYKNFIEILNQSDRDHIIGELQKIFRDIRKMGVNRAEDIYVYYIDLLFKLVTWLETNNENAISVFGSDVNFYHKIRRFDTVDEIENWILNMMEWIIDYMHNKKEKNVNRDVLRGQEFMRLNYKENLTLKMVSDYAGLSESHFSRLFTKHTGENFTVYLTNLRIQKAKQLINETNMKMYEIAERVGYSNIEHFSRVFKKVTGVAPNQYKHN